MIPDEEYSPNRKAGLIDNILSCTKIVCDAFDGLGSEEREELRNKVADIISDSAVSLESILDVYRTGLPGFSAKWQDLEAEKTAESRRAVLEHILAERYGSKLHSAT